MRYRKDIESGLWKKRPTISGRLADLSFKAAHKTYRFVKNRPYASSAAASTYKAYNLAKKPSVAKKNPYPTPSSDRKRKSNNKSLQQAKKFKLDKEMPKKYKAKNYKKVNRMLKSNKRRQMRSMAKRSKGRTGYSNKQIINPPVNCYFTQKNKKLAVHKHLQLTRQEVSYQTDSERCILALGGRQSGDDQNHYFAKIATPTTLSGIFETGSQRYTGGTIMAGQYVQDELAANTLYNKYLLSKFTTQLRLTNQGPSKCEVKAYLIVAKSNDTNDFSPWADWSNGYNAQDGVTGTTTPDEIGAYPWESKRFNNRWKIKKTVKFRLDVGGEQNIKFQYDINKIIDTSYIEDFNTYGGLTHQWFIVAQGIMGDGDNQWQHTAGSITTTPVKIVGLQTVRYQARMISSYPKINFKANTNLEAVTPVTGGAAQKIWVIADHTGATVDTSNSTLYA